MTNKLLAAIAIAGALTAGCGLVGNDGERQAAVVRGVCGECHNATDLDGGLNLKSRSFDQVAADAEVWEKAIAKLRAGLMPPAEGGRTLDRDKRE